MTHEQRRALEILADAGQHGATEATMLAHGFWREMLAGLVLAGLATVVTETVRAGGPIIKVERYRITDDGRPSGAGIGVRNNSGRDLEMPPCHMTKKQMLRPPPKPKGI